MVVVMLYQTTVKPDAIDTMDEIREGFKVLYEKHGINVIGYWKSIEHPNESFYMVQYESDDDYQNKTRALHDDQQYLRLTSQLNEVRTDFKSTKLSPK
ncbi:MAG: NIPSNAP family protein [Candidatus Thorarchaeota archaeon]